MGMMGHGRAPGVQDQGCADAGAQMFWIGSGLEQEAVDHRLVVPGERADRCWFSQPLPRERFSPSDFCGRSPKKEHSCNTDFPGFPVLVSAIFNVVMMKEDD